MNYLPNVDQPNANMTTTNLMMKRKVVWEAMRMIRHTMRATVKGHTQ